MQKIRFNTGWIYKNENGEKPVQLPHDAMIERVRETGGGNTVNTGYFQGEKDCYKKIFTPKKDSQSMVLEFDGVYHNAEVYLNGLKVAQNRYGYSNFIVDISETVKYGEENTLEVRVDNSETPNSRWYTGTGIYRELYAYESGEIYTLPDDIQISTPDVEADLAVVEIHTKLRSVAKDEHFVWVRHQIYDALGKLVTEDEAPATINENMTEATLRYYVPNPILWSDKQPYLYTCKTTLLEDGQVLDETTNRFGIRKIQVDPVHGFRLNGECIKLRGGCIHHDNGIIGAREFKDASVRKVKMMKAAGFNALRISHHPASKVILEACDEVGMLVMDESFDMWNVQMNDNIYDFHLYFKECWKTIVDNWVRKNFNHPSVIMYSIGNEIPEIGTHLGGKTSRELAERVRSLDHTRFVTNAINGMMCVMDDMDSIIPMVFTEEEIKEKQIKRPVTDINYALTLFLDRTTQINMLDKVTELLAESTGVLDIVGYNYVAERYAQEAKDRPNRITMGSETFPPEIGRNWPWIEGISQCVGDFCWTAWDYLGETGIGAITYNIPPNFSQPYPFYMAYVGDFDLTGFRRPTSYYREIVWGLRKEPYIGVWDPGHQKDFIFFTTWSIGPAVHSWTWREEDIDTKTKVEVYSDAPEVELFLNGKSLGIQATSQCRAIFEVAYVPGELKAVAIRDGKACEQHILKTVGEATHVAVREENMDELIYLTFELADENGQLNMLASDEITLNVKNAKLLGMGSANATALTNFFDITWENYEGRLQAVLRKENNAPIEVEMISKRFGTMHKML